MLKGFLKYFFILIIGINLGYSQHYTTPFGQNRIQYKNFDWYFYSTNNFDIYQKLLMLRSHGWGKDLSADYRNNLLQKYGLDDFHDPFTFFDLGYNLRGTDLQSFIGIRQIAKAPNNTILRYQNHTAYGKHFNGSLKYQNWSDNMPASISFAA